MRNPIRSALRRLGEEIRRLGRGSRSGGQARPPLSIGRFLQHLSARGFRPRGIIDVGANCGDWTRLALSVFPGTPVLLIEPLDEMEASLRRLCTEAPGCRHVKAGAGRTEGELIQTIWEDLAGSSFLPEADAAQLSSGRQRRTRIVTIDGLLSGAHRGFEPDLVKLDIQGFELEALSGAEGLFGRSEVFILEASLFRFLPHMPIVREVVAFMAERGYELYDLTDYLRRPLDGALGQVDLAFVKGEGRFRRESTW